MIAEMFEVEGYATISCLVDAGGALTDCAVVDEGPAGLGFGAAAVSLSSSFHMRPKTVDGAPVAGGDVRIPIRFALPKPAVPAEAQASQDPQDPPPPSQQAVVTARRALLAEDFPGYLETKYARLTEVVTSSSSPGVTLQTRQRAAATIKSAVTAITPKELEAASGLLAGYEPEDAMAADATFFESPEGKSYWAKRYKANAATAKRLKPARDRFFQTMQCQWSRAKVCTALSTPLEPQPAPAVSPDQLALGRAIAEADTALATRFMGPLENVIASAPEERRKALKSAADAMMDAARVAETYSYAEQFTAPELRAILAYKQGPGGRFELEGATKLGMAFRRLERKFDQMTMAAAKREFCPGDACAAPLPPPTGKEIDVPPTSNFVPPFNSR
ncbi:energy transducer TonB family protein [Phenylobacterium aquaticum]|uniref:energy transducer TonB family protein n=1 Tax=Phenylobacterium aquaticum TaxID=1763816 RepID=UPI001F5C7397|nr:energy transducer TonB [Phenylobacterium aquaticum]MCI3135574.1 energy transducer TonB [Phenylobacterium aquaticum]